MKMWTLQNRRSFLKTVGAGLGMGLAGPSGTLAAPAGLRAGESSATVRYRWVSVREIHGDGTHNAWPDICRWRGRYYVAFNSGGKNHGGGHGLSVLSSADGLNWETVLHKPAGEWGILEDTTRTTVCPKFLPLKDRLILVFYFYTAGDMTVSSQRKADLKRRWLNLKGSEESFERWVGHHNTSFRTGVSYSEDGRSFRDPESLLDPGWRVWRPQTFQGRHYIIGYRCHGQEWSFSPELEGMIPQADSIEMFESASLFSSGDGLGWSKGQRYCRRGQRRDRLRFRPGWPYPGGEPQGRFLQVASGSQAGESACHRLRQSSALSELAATAPGPTDPGSGSALGQGSMDGRRPLYRRGDRAVSSPPPELSPQGAALRDPHVDPGGSDRRPDPGGNLAQLGRLFLSGHDRGANGDLLVVYYSHSITTDGHQYMGGGLWPGKMPPSSIYLARVVREEMG